MKFLVSVLVLAALVLPLLVVSAPAGHRERAEARREARLEKPDSRTLCYILSPWPWRSCAEVEQPRVAVPVVKTKPPVEKKVEEKPIEKPVEKPIEKPAKKPEPPAEVVKEFIDTGKITTTKILFETGKSELKPESKKELDAIGEILAQVEGLKIEIGGHTDSQGSADMNMRLSQERAAAVRDYILKNFPQCDPDLLVAKGYGLTIPVATNETAAGQAQNRRVEFTIVK